jgi:hypothetical protein
MHAIVVLHAPLCAPSCRRESDCKGTSLYGHRPSKAINSASKCEVSHFSLMKSTYSGRSKKLQRTELNQIGAASGRTPNDISCFTLSTITLVSLRQISKLHQTTSAECAACTNRCAHREGPVSKNPRRWLIFMIFVPDLFSLGYAQQTVPAADATSTNLQLNVIVTPKSGVPVTSLQKGDFTLTDNKSPRQITFWYLGRERAFADFANCDAAAYLVRREHSGPQDRSLGISGLAAAFWCTYRTRWKATTVPIFRVSKLGRTSLRPGFKCNNPRFKCHYAMINSRKIVENKQQQFRDLKCRVTVVSASVSPRVFRIGGTFSF